MRLLRVPLLAFLIVPLWQASMPKRYLATWMKKNDGAIVECRTPIRYSADSVWIGRDAYKTGEWLSSSEALLFHFNGPGGIKETLTIDKMKDADGFVYYEAKWTASYAIVTYRCKAVK